MRHAMVDLARRGRGRPRVTVEAVRPRVRAVAAGRTWRHISTPITVTERPSAAAGSASYRYHVEIH